MLETKEVRRRLPKRLVYEIDRVRGRQVPKEIALERLDLLRHVDAEWLRDPRRLTTLIREMGLSDYHPDIMPPAMYWSLGKGLLTLQYPHQFAAYLVSLADLPITSYVEIGTDSGGSFATTIAYLEATGHKIERALAIDPQYAPGLARLERNHPAVTFMQTVSSDSVVQTLLSQGTWDLAFIDGDHSYSACLADFELVRSAGVRVIALHDIVDAGAPDVRRVWEKIRREHVDAYEFKEFIEQYPDVTERTQTTHCGIGVAVAMS